MFAAGDPVAQARLRSMLTAGRFTSLAGLQKVVARGGGGVTGGGGDGGGSEGGGEGGFGGGGAQRPLSPANMRLRPVHEPVPLYETLNVASI